VIPPGAQEILYLRLAGKRPDEFVVCSTIGALPFNWVVDVDFNTDWDLMWAVDLDVVVVAQSTDRVDPFLRQFIKHRPRSLTLWLDDSAGGFDVRFWPAVDTISKPIDQWVWEVDMLPMMGWQNLAMLELMSGEFA